MVFETGNFGTPIQNKSREAKTKKQKQQIKAKKRG
jgi:hypothetical protein